LGIAEPEGRRFKKGPSLDLGTANTVCPCCGQFHRLARYFYTFPELAPDSFKEKKYIQSRAKEAL